MWTFGSGRFFLIGGGELASGETLSLDRELVALTRVERPRALFIPTASEDAQSYEDAFRRVYGEQLGCRVETLYLCRDIDPPFEVRAKLHSADLVYVGGGNTLAMLRRWRKLGVDRLLRRECGRGLVLGGISAGMICWFADGHSDSRRYSQPEGWEWMKVRGLGLLPGMACPHCDGEGRLRSFEEMVAREGGQGLALDDGCALAVDRGRCRVLASRPGAGLYRVTGREGRAVTKRIEAGGPARTFSELFGG